MARLCLRRVAPAYQALHAQAIVRAVALRPELLGPDSPLLVDTVHGAAGTGCLPVDPTLVHALLLRLLADDGGVGLLRQTNLAEVLIKVRKCPCSLRSSRSL